MASADSADLHHGLESASSEALDPGNISLFSIYRAFANSLGKSETQAGSLPMQSAEKNIEERLEELKRPFPSAASNDHH